MAEVLNVFHGTELVGTLVKSADETLFAYASSWLEHSGAFALSLSLPLEGNFDPVRATRFFANLLPEANVRTLVARRLGISEGNDFALLRAIGGECAGALSILPEDASPDDQETEYELLSPKKLVDLATRYEALPAVDGKGRVRLSLAGAQDKLPVFVEGKRFFLPIGNSPSTHIVKFPNRNFKHLPANEALVAELANQVGLPVSRTRWHPSGEEGLCVVERYDRIRNADGTVSRLHQEDFCQALGVAPSQKYEEEGGPSFATVLALVRDHSTQPLVDVPELLRWLAFNAIVGNADGHAKNLALLYHHGSRLAPFYDLVCTRAYDRIERRLAMAIGGERDPDKLRAPHLQSASREIDVKKTLLVDTFVEIANAVLERLPQAIDAASVTKSPAVQRVKPLIQRQAKRVLRDLAL